MTAAATVVMAATAAAVATRLAWRPVLRAWQPRVEVVPDFSRVLAGWIPAP